MTHFERIGIITLLAASACAQEANGTPTTTHHRGKDTQHACAQKDAHCISAPLQHVVALLVGATNSDSR